MRFNHFALFAVATLAFASCGSSISIEERIEDTLSHLASGSDDMRESVTFELR